MQDVALQCAAETCRLVGSLPNHLRSQQDQAVRASARIPLAIAEGAGRQGRDRRHLWRVAYGTARETTAVVELLVALEVVDIAAGRALLGRLDRVQAMLWRAIASVAG
jgi:four helix bundle protein